MWIGQNVDLTTQYRMLRRVGTPFRPVPGNLYTPGLCVKLAPLDSQPYYDQSAIIPTSTAQNQRLLVGVVAPWWPGFGGSVNPGVFAAPSGTAQRGTTGVDVVVGGFHGGLLVDQSGTGAVTITNEVPLLPSRATAGYMQGIGAAAQPGPNGTIAIAMLPASGIGSSLTAAALVQASQTFTVATPANGDTLNLNLQAPYTDQNPGIVQFLNYQLQLNATTAATATTAAAAMVSFLNAQPSFSNFFVATNAAGVLTVAVNALSSPFMVTGGNGIGANGLGMQFTPGLSGVVGNSLLCNSSVIGIGTTTFVAGGANLAGGAGYKGFVPGWIIC